MICRVCEKVVLTSLLWVMGASPAQRELLSFDTSLLMKLMRERLLLLQHANNRKIQPDCCEMLSIYWLNRVCALKMRVGLFRRGVAASCVMSGNTPLLQATMCCDCFNFLHRPSFLLIHHEVKSSATPWRYRTSHWLGRGRANVVCPPSIG